MVHWLLAVLTACLLAGCGGGGGGAPSTVAGPTVGSLYITNLQSNLVAPWALDAAGDNPVSLAASSAGAQPVAMTMSADGRYLYVANYQGNSVSAFQRNLANGLLTPLSPASQATVGTGPLSLALALSGKYLYVATTGSNAVTRFSVSTVDGSLSNRQELAMPAPPLGLAVNAARNQLYATFLDHKLRVFNLDPATGDATLSQTLDTNLEPYDVKLNAQGSLLVVVNATAHTVSSYVIDAGTGVLSTADDVLMDGDAQNGSRPLQAALSPRGDFLYVVDHSAQRLSVFGISMPGGALTRLDTPAGKMVPTTQRGPTAIAINAAGNRLYVLNSDSNTMTTFVVDVSGWPAMVELPTGVGSGPWSLLLAP